MTPPALIVLFLAHVCSIIGTSLGPTADYDKQTNKKTNMRIYNAHSSHPNLWTNSYKKLDGNSKQLYKTKNNTIENEARSLNKFRFKRSSNNMRIFNESMVGKKRIKREDARCELFKMNDKTILHPHHSTNNTYYSNINCVTVVTAPKDQVIELTFVDEFQIEYHPNCDYDYLEIRDGKQGYGKLLGRICGTTFPPVIQTAGPYAWLKFHADDTIEYSGFKILVEYKPGPGQSVPDSCYIPKGGRYGNLTLDLNDEVTKLCKDESTTNLDILWTITTPENTKIYLNFTTFKLAVPNECEQNVVEVFGAVPEMDHRIVQYCGSIANPVSTKVDDLKNDKDKGNVMNVRVYVSQMHRKTTSFFAIYTAFRTVNPSKEEKCNDEDEFDCDDNTCIDSHLVCDHEAHCRLKTDEDPEHCKTQVTSTINQPHIMVILIIFSLILSAMSFVFLFTCIRKLYQDHKIIKEHIRESCEDRLDAVGSRLTLDAKRLQRDSEPRASLERDNRTNELFKRKRDSFSKRKTSIDSDYIQETHLDMDDEPWRREVDSVPIEAEEVRIERDGRSRRSEKERHELRSERGSERQSERRSDTSKKEESLRSKRETEEKERKKEIRDVSVGPPDMKDSGCQTRESLFQTDPPPSSDGSRTTGTNSRGFSTFGYSGATIARPSPPAVNTSEITIELMRQASRESGKPQKKIQDRRPMSTETTRSAPDVIIVSKPIR